MSTASSKSSPPTAAARLSSTTTSSGRVVSTICFTSRAPVRAWCCASGRGAGRRRSRTHAVVERRRALGALVGGTIEVALMPRWQHPQRIAAGPPTCTCW